MRVFACVLSVCVFVRKTVWIILCEMKRNLAREFFYVLV